MHKVNTSFIATSSPRISWFVRCGHFCLALGDFGIRSSSMDDRKPGLEETVHLDMQHLKVSMERCRPVIVAHAEGLIYER